MSAARGPLAEERSAAAAPARGVEHDVLHDERDASDEAREMNPLLGVWSRTWIRRAPTPGAPLGQCDDSVEVCYVQTPWAFVDVRRPIDPCKRDGTLAFAGVTTWRTCDSDDDGDFEFEARWHTCADLEWGAAEADGGAAKSAAAWSAADGGAPFATADIGRFTRDEHADDLPSPKERWREVDPEATLECVVREEDGGGRFLARRRGSALLVAAGGRWALADGAVGRFAAGRVVTHDQAKGPSAAAPRPRWVVELCADNRALEGQLLQLEGNAAEWLPLRGESAAWARLAVEEAAPSASYPLPLFLSTPSARSGPPVAGHE